MDAWMDWTGLDAVTGRAALCVFTGGHWLCDSEMCNKAIAHCGGAASVLLVTTSHQMTYTTLVFHRRYDSRCRPGNKHGCARACREHTEEGNAQREARQ